MATQAAQLNGDALVEPVPAGVTRSGAARLDAIDMLRGLVIVFMVLDHVRDFFHVSVNSFDPTDPVQSYPLLYVTRWITHLCAPTFVFLAGVSIFLQRANGKAGADLSRFLLTRGAWLVFLEVTVVTFGFNFGVSVVFLQVIWAIGISMICMAALARLPSVAVLIIGVAILLIYPLVAAATEGATGAAAIIRIMTVAPNLIPGTPILAFYAAIPWLGVMCLGFGLGPSFRLERERTRILLPLALGLLVAFVIMRALNGYGDPAPWKTGATETQTVMSFMNVSKYPPSPDYVCATLGTSMLIFLALQHFRGGQRAFCSTSAAPPCLPIFAISTSHTALR
ncbi:DUF1624 domain-containing protein [Sphingomonas piscis]|uniref:DUF1624 domain-containing protein n=1 Tax=Sphingomonas piscis TaxID=2714943 RepID=A0A6G7YLG9_9SPHN|nr:heparan-alpha-glucosaminide N-acetyltransferase domain-containing protein [Sphingomonas piscis]QIK77556.1 DUF1624 domain-containing protein [Sphingomonas piscis]